MDPENETPLPQSKKLLPFPNTAVTYRECLRNHAASIGRHAVDGCGEFILSPIEPTSYKCAACSCHRNFHRREPTTTAARTHFIDFHRNSTSTSSSPPSPSPSPQPTNYTYGQRLVLSLNKQAADRNHTVATPGTPVAVKISGRKRFRTIFSEDQKEKMSVFAEKVGWKMLRCDDKMVAEFCNEIGIRSRIFKVWMHNNKNSLAKKDTTNTAISATVIPTAVAAIHQENGSGSSSSS